jgi:hypothetical protein
MVSIAALRATQQHEKNCVAMTKKRVTWVSPWLVIIRQIRAGKDCCYDVLFFFVYRSKEKQIQVRQ